MEQAPRLVLACAERHGGEVLGRHQFADRLPGVLREADVSVGEYAAEPPRGVGHRNPADAVGGHDRLRLAERSVGQNGDRIDHHAALVTLDRAHRGGLLIHLHIAVEHPDAAQLRHRDRHVRLGHGVHRGADHRDIEADRAGEPGGGVRHRRQDRALGRTQQHIVEGQAEGDVHCCHFHALAPLRGAIRGGPCNDGSLQALERRDVGHGPGVTRSKEEKIRPAPVPSPASETPASRGRGRFAPAIREDRP